MSGNKHKQTGYELVYRLFFDFSVSKPNQKKTIVYLFFCFKTRMEKQKMEKKEIVFFIYKNQNGKAEKQRSSGVFSP